MLYHASAAPESFLAELIACLKANITTIAIVTAGSLHAVNEIWI